MIPAASSFGTVHGALHSTAFAVAVEAVLLVVAIFYLGVAHWVYGDARRRIRDPWLVATSTAMALAVPFLGAVVYMLFRPPETLEDVRTREIEVRALEERLSRAAARCPVCRVAVEPSFIVCPVCTTQLKHPCTHCAAPLEPLWQVCPYCATPVAAVSLEPVRADLDLALAAEAAVNGNGRAAARRAANVG